MTRSQKSKSTANKTVSKTKSVNRSDRTAKPLHDALGPAAKDFGQEIKPLGKELGQLTVNSVRNLLIKPLSNTIWGLERAPEWISNNVSQKLSGKKPEELIELDARIALTTLQALIYSGNDETIREMFSNLLASGMTKEISSNVHPAFVELIKQMTNVDAKVISHIAINTGQAKFELRLSNPGDIGSFHTFGHKLSFMSSDEKTTSNDDLLVSLSNLERLGLVEVTYEKYPNNDLVRATIDGLTKLYEGLINKQKQSFHIHTSGIYITPLGQRFVEICLPDAKQDSLTPSEPRQASVDDETGTSNE